MTLWRRGTPFDLDESLKVFSVAEFRQGRKWILAGIKQDGSVICSLRQWEGATTFWSPPRLVTNKKYLESISIDIWESERDAYFQVVVATDSGGDHFWIQPEKLEDLEEEPEPPKLVIQNGIFCYKDGGTIPIELIGVSRVEALWRGKGITENRTVEVLDWGDKSQAWYEGELIKYKINYVRHLALDDFQYVYDHCVRMKNAGIIVEVIVFRGVKEGLLIRLEDAANLIELGNVFFDAHNEFGDNEGDVASTIEIIEYIVSKGGIIGAGAWGWSHFGQDNSDEFFRRCNTNQVITVHRDEFGIGGIWSPEGISKYVDGRPVIRNEYFARYEPALTLEDTKRIMRETFEADGQGIQYYGFAIPEIGLNDPFEYWEILKYAGELCEKLNGER